MKSQLHPKLAKLLERNERTADGVLFCSLEVILGRVREVTNSKGQREYRRWKPTKRLARLMAGEDVELARCGAKCRNGQPCRAHVVRGRKRCRNHGGLSTGPRSQAGRDAIAASNRRRADTKCRED